MSGPLARPPRERLRSMLLERYGADPTFGASLEALFTDHCASLPPDLAKREPNGLRDALAKHFGEGLTTPSSHPRFARLDIQAIDTLTWKDHLTGEPDDAEAAGWGVLYLAAVRDLAESSGLSRLDPRTAERSFSTGERVVHDWLAARSGYLNVRPSWLSMMFPFAAWLPARRQTITIQWDPQSETRDAAQKRAYAQVRGALVTIDKGWIAAGFDRRRSAQEERDMDWLYEKIRGRSFGSIAADGDGTDDRELVQRAVDRMADAAGVDRAGW